MQYSSLDQTCHELIFFSFAESFQFLFLHLYCLFPKYMALTSQHFLPVLTEVGHFHFSLKYLIGMGQASKGRSWSSGMHLQGSCSQHLAFLKGVISHLLMRTLPLFEGQSGVIIPVSQKQNWGHLPQLKSQSPHLQPQAISAECCSNWHPAVGTGKPHRKEGLTWGCSLAYCHHIMVSHFTPHALRSASELQGI